MNRPEVAVTIGLGHRMSGGQPRRPDPTYIGDRKGREEYMDILERQMEDQREQIRRTPDRMGARAGAGEH